ncbi:MAG: aminoacyl-tRNA hydrolase [Clostridia bacterium]|nr:aminoacyl-tRNA hydrolase [Clostridia bacterium]
MYVIAGLGNPGKKYEKTRHNMGFLVLDEFASMHGIRVSKIKHKALCGEGIIAGEKVLLVKPQTYMNLSGESLREVMSYYDVPAENLIVIYDDLDLETGALRIRKKGSSGSHNGMKSVIYQLQTDEFPRIRIGIGAAEGLDWKDFVTGTVSREEADVLADSIRKAAESIDCILEDGIDIAMNRYNTGKKKTEDGKEGND